MLNENFVYLGILISAIGLSSYFIDTVKGKIQPNKVSFALWSLAPLIAFFAQIKQEIGVQSLMTLSAGLFPVIILLGSSVNKKAYWKLTKFDVCCGLISLAGLVFWQLTRVGNIAIFFSIVSDGLAYLPTVKKAYIYPETESAWPWLATALSGLITSFTTTNWNFAHIGFPLYYFVTNVVVYIIVQFKVGKENKYV